MKTLYKYELFYFLKTPRAMVLSVLAIFLSLLSVITARYIHHILEWALAAEGIENIDLSEGTIVDAYAQFFNNYQQIFFLVVLFIIVGMFTKEKAQNMYPYLLTHPVARSRIVLAKFTVATHVIFASLVIGSIIFGFYALVIFEGFNVLPFSLAILVFMMLIKFFMLLVGVIAHFNGSYIMSLTVGIVLYILFGALSGFDQGPLAWMPWRLYAFPMLIVQDQLTWSEAYGALLSVIVLSILLLFANVSLFNKQALHE